MPDVVRVVLDGGGSVLVSAAGEPDVVPGEGPVKAGRAGERMGDIVHVATVSLREALEPVTQMSEQVLEQLGKAKPHGVEVEFGIELSAEAGAIVTRAGGACHLTVKLTWEAPGGS